MAQSGKGKLNYRCPICFMRDLKKMWCCFAKAESSLNLSNTLCPVLRSVTYC